MIVIGRAVADWISDRVQMPVPALFQAIGLERHGQIVAGAWFTNWTGFDCEITVATERRGINRLLLQAWGHYVADTLGCGRVTIISEQAHVIDLALRLGGQIEGKKRNNYGPGRDGWIVGILREDWQFFRK